MRKLKVAIVGLGTVSQVHRLIIENSNIADLVAVCDIDKKRFKTYENVHFYDSLDKMLGNEDLDIVHICLPHYLHVKATKKCVENGINVFMEKPVAMSYEEGKDLSLFLKDNDKKVAVCFQNRLNRSSVELKRILSENQNSDRIKSIKGIVCWARPIEYYLSSPWRGEMLKAGGGTIINQSIHTLDLIQWLSNEKLKTCKAKLLNLSDMDIEVEDTAISNFSFDKDVQGLYFATNCYKDNSPVEIEVITDLERYVIKDYGLYKYNKEIDELELLIKDEILEGTKAYYGHSHKMAIENFYNSVITGNDNYCSVEEALISMKMIDLMKKSSKEDRKVKMEEIL